MAASEFLVTIGASAGFLLGLTTSEIPLKVVAALLVGGVIAAPFAAWVVRLLSARIMGTLVGGIILLTNTRTFLKAVGLDEPQVSLPLYVVVAAGWLTALVAAIRSNRRDRAEQQQQADQPVHHS